MLNRIYLICLSIFIIVGPAYAGEVTSFESLPFYVEWGQTKMEVNNKLIERGQILEEEDNVLYYVIPPRNGYSYSSHFIFSKKGRLYRIVMLGVCDTAVCVNTVFDELYAILENSKYNKIYSEGRLRHIYHDPLTKSYIMLKEFTTRSYKHVVAMEYELDVVSPMKKHHK